MFDGAMTHIRRIVLRLAALAVAIPAGAQSTADLRTFFFRRDFEGGYRTGLVAMGSTATPEERAWFVANEARYGLVDEALVGADSIARRSPWRLFARVVALCETAHPRSAIPLARSLVASRPIQPDYLWAYAYALLVSGHYAAAAAALDSAPQRGVPETAELRALQGDALSLLALGPDPDSTARPRALAAFADAQRLDSMNVDAYYFEGAHLANGAADTVAAARLGRAALLSPFAPAIHTAVLGRTPAPPRSSRRHDARHDRTRRRDDPAPTWRLPWRTLLGRPGV